MTLGGRHMELHLGPALAAVSSQDLRHYSICSSDIPRGQIMAFNHKLYSGCSSQQNCSVGSCFFFGWIVLHYLYIVISISNF
jgi:hypothetical protein